MTGFLAMTARLGGKGVSAGNTTTTLSADYADYTDFNGIEIEKLKVIKVFNPSLSAVNDRLLRRTLRSSQR
ncbi:MAG: hypothetical protein NTW04_05650, partial [Elusimicrobia bacterium]|nr:hypothetical protein [Elusimicrobiota bacterium]